MTSSQVPALSVLLLLAEKVEFVQPGLVESGLVDGEEGGGVLVAEPNPIALVVDHPRCLLWRSNRVSWQPVCVFGGVSDGGISGSSGGWWWADPDVPGGGGGEGRPATTVTGGRGRFWHVLGGGSLGEGGVGHPAAAADGVAVAVAADPGGGVRPDDAAVAEASPTGTIDPLNQFRWKILDRRVLWVAHIHTAFYFFPPLFLLWASSLVVATEEKVIVVISRSVNRQVRASSLSFAINSRRQVGRPRAN